MPTSLFLFLHFHICCILLVIATLSLHSRPHLLYSSCHHYPFSSFTSTFAVFFLSSLPFLFLHFHICSILLVITSLSLPSLPHLLYSSTFAHLLYHHYPFSSFTSTFAVFFLSSLPFLFLHFHICCILLVITTLSLPSLPHLLYSSCHHYPFSSFTSTFALFFLSSLAFLFLHFHICCILLVITTLSLPSLPHLLYSSCHHYSFPSFTSTFAVFFLSSLLFPFLHFHICSILLVITALSLPSLPHLLYSSCLAIVVIIIIPVDMYKPVDEYIYHLFTISILFLNRSHPVTDPVSLLLFPTIIVISSLNMPDEVHLSQCYDMAIPQHLKPIRFSISLQ